ncbi:MAG: KTSC domain-containing protein, partial [Acidobacteriales bacterium]|nr:KTSC domain-containing protein [Terriglobales bacterium]
MTTATSARVRLDSTTLAAALYDDRRETLELDFRDGTRYLYSGIAPNLYRELLRALSKGSFFNRQIRSRFP